MRHLRAGALLASVIFIFAACGSSKQASKAELIGTWQASSIVIDGDSKDWPAPYPAYDAKAKIGYAVSNDRDKLYITMECGDVMTQMKILRSGLKVWIDTSGGKSQRMVINYPLPAENGAMQQEFIHEEQDQQNNNTQSLDREKRMQRRVRKGLDDAIQLSFEGFAACNGGFLVKQINSCGINVRMGIDEFNEMIWEAAIPFKMLYGKDHIDKKDEGRPLSVCFQVDGIKKPEKPKDASGGMNEGGGGGMHGAGGGMRGAGGGMNGGGGKGGGGQGSDGRESMFETSKTWKQFGIAFKEQ